MAFFRPPLGPSRLSITIRSRIRSAFQSKEFRDCHETLDSRHGIAYVGVRVESYRSL